jgi:hypothetical protein
MNHDNSRPPETEGISNAIRDASGTTSLYLGECQVDRIDIWKS